jgi:flagellar biosynthetic protein FliR
MPEKLLGFVMVLTRISAFFLLVPVFGWKLLPVVIKVAVAMLLAIFFSSKTASAVSGSLGNPEQFSFMEVILLVANEATYGLALGLVVVLIFTVVKFSGQIAENQMGFSMVELFDPFTNEETQPIGSLLEMIFIILFLSANGHHLFLLIMSRSFEVFPAGSIPTISILAGGVMKAGSTMFIAALRLAAPMLTVFLLFMIVLAILARIVPEMNIFFISFPLRVGLGLLMTTVFLPFIYSFIGEFADWMGKLLPL